MFFLIVQLLQAIKQCRWKQEEYKPVSDSTVAVFLSHLHPYIFYNHNRWFSFPKEEICLILKHEKLNHLNYQNVPARNMLNTPALRNKMSLPCKCHWDLVFMVWELPKYVLWIQGQCLQLFASANLGLHRFQGAEIGLSKNVLVLKAGERICSNICFYRIHLQILSN